MFPKRLTSRSVLNEPSWKIVRTPSHTGAVRQDLIDSGQSEVIHERTNSFHRTVRACITGVLVLLLPLAVFPQKVVIGHDLDVF